MQVDYSKYADKVKFWKASIENVKDFVGTSPPSVFVGRFGFPKVFVGILSPPHHDGNASLLDAPEMWYEQKAGISDILNYRGQMVYSRFSSNVKNARGRLMDVTQEVAMAKRSADVEIELAKNPIFKFDFNRWTQPIGNPAPVADASLVENPSTQNKVEYLVSDTDTKAQEAVVELFKHDIPVSQIQKIFSVGLLGLKTQRKLVPTRWSITAVDDIISKSLISKILDYQQTGEIRLFHNEYLGNHYEILVIPGHYQLELVEIWNVDTQPSIGQDYEDYWLRETYASNTHGAFYSSRYAVGSYLEKIKRQASVLIVREILPSYDVPMGIWQLRETVKDAFNKPYEKFDTVNQAVSRICQRLISKGRWIHRSKLLNAIKQPTLRKFTETGSWH